MRRAWALVLVGCSTHIAVDDDAGPDAARVDATVDDAGDAASDAGSEAAGEAGTRYCDTRSPKDAFCDDFDRGDLGATWDFKEQTPPGVATLDVATFVTPPAAFGIVTRKLTDTSFGTVLLRKTVSGGASRAHLGFDVYADDVQTTGTVAIATLDLALDHLLTLYLRDDDPSAPGPTLTELPPGATASARNPFTRVPAAGKWTRVELDVDAAGGTATLTFDGTAVLSAVPLAKARATDPTIRVGVLVSGPAAPYTMRFDDVSLDVVP